MKFLKNILLIITGFVTFLLLVAVIISRFYGDKIAGYAIDKLNRHIRTSVTAENISFTLLRKFPDATVVLRNVYIISVPDFKNTVTQINTDTLLFAKDIFIQFSLIHLLRSEYLIREVHVNKGMINIFTDFDGKDNYRFWESNKFNNDSNFHIELENIKISNVLFRNKNLVKRTNILANVDRLILHGDLYKKEYLIDFLFDGHIFDYSINGFKYINEKKFSVRTNIHVVNNVFHVSKSDLAIEGLRFNVEGNAKMNELLSVDLEIKGSDLSIKNLLKNLPFKSITELKTGLETGGKLSFQARVTGYISNTRMPAIQAKFSIEDGFLSGHIFAQKFENINAEGYISTGDKQSSETSILKITKVSLIYGNSKLGGDFQVRNLMNPEISYNLKADLDLTDFSKYIEKTAMLESCTGNLLIQMKMSGHQEELFKIKEKDLIDWDYNGHIGFDQIRCKFRNNRLTVQNLNGNLVFDNHLCFSNLNLIISGNDLNISGRIDNLPEYLISDQSNLLFDLNVYAENIFIDSLINLSDRSQGVADTTALLFPMKVNLKSKFWFDQLHYKNFQAYNIRGDLNYKPGSILFNSVDFSSMDGTVKSNGLIEKNNSDLAVKINSEIEQIDINSLFKSFNNFGQTFIMHDNLKGKLQGSVNFYATLDKNLDVKKESILAESDIKIFDGELIHFEPMMGLSKFIEVEELEHVYFSTLTNQIFIRNCEVVIPKMDIYSSALDINGSGIHNFNNFFTYKVNLNLSDLLLKKSPERKLEFEEHVIEDDGLGITKIFLTIEGTPEDYKISYDRKSANMELKEKLSNETVELKTILNEEFGLFKKDSFQVKEEAIEKQDFIIQWEDDDIEMSDTIAEGKKKKQKFVIEWDEDDNDTIIQKQNSRKISK